MKADGESLWPVVEARDASIARLIGSREELRAEMHARLRVEADAREQVLLRLEQALLNQEQALLNKERVIEDLKAELREKESIVKLNTTLEEKEAVIREQRQAIAAYRATYSVLGMFIRPLNFIILSIRGAFRRTVGQFTPRLGVLHQHPPAKLKMPADYAATPVPQPAPRISIVTPSFRQSRFIERTIMSVLGQGYPDLEYHVQDGASKDGTVEILERYTAKLASWVSEKDSGQTQAINRAFAKTSGEIMAWINSDDILFPGALAYVADYFNRNPDIDVVYGHRVLIDADDREIGRWILPPHDDAVLSWADFVPQETLFWRRSIWEKAGGQVDETFRFAMDWDLLLRFRKAGARFARLPRFIGGFRVHADQKTSADITDIGFKEMNRLREREIGHVPTPGEVRKAVFPYMARHTMTDIGWRIRNRFGAAA